MIDDALLRPGRLEVHVEIGLPDEAGRLQILHIHTRSMVSLFWSLVSMLQKRSPVEKL